MIEKGAGGGGANSSGDAQLESSINRVLFTQIAVAILLLGIIILDNFFIGFLDNIVPGRFVSGFARLQATVYGSGLAIVGTILSARSIRRSSRYLGQSALVPIYSGLLNKLVIVGGGIAVGLIVFALHPMFVVTGYLVVQLASAWTMVSSKNNFRTN